MAGYKKPHIKIRWPYIDTYTVSAVGLSHHQSFLFSPETQTSQDALRHIIKHLPAIAARRAIPSMAQSL